MTIKEIADLTGKTERSIRLWAEKTSEKISGLSEKISDSAKTKKPANFTLGETLSILRAGGISESLISLLEKNAAETAGMKPTNNLELVESSLNSAWNAIETLAKTVSVFVGNIPKTKQIEMEQDYFTILGFCRLKKIECTQSDAINWGKAAKKLCAERGLEVRKVQDERFGLVGSYPKSVLECVFEM